MNFTIKVNMTISVYDKEPKPMPYRSGQTFQLSYVVREDNIFNAKKMAEDIAVKEIAPEIAANRHSYECVRVVTNSFDVLETHL